MEKQQSMRLDKWLKIARIFKQRSKAADAVDAGQVKVNDERVKPSKAIHIGDKLTVKKGKHYYECTIKGLATRSISAKLAKELYEVEETASRNIDSGMAELLKLMEEQEKKDRKKYRGKLNKKERRGVNKQKYGD